MQKAKSQLFFENSENNPIFCFILLYSARGKEYTDTAVIYYIFILLAVTAFTLQFVLTKLFSAAAREGGVAAFCMLIAVGLAGAAAALIASGGRVHLSGASLWLALLFALVMIPYHTLSVKALALGDLSTYSVFMMLGGMLLPFLYGILLLDEAATVGKILGCVLLSVGIVWQGYIQGRGKGKAARGGLYLTLCLIIFIVNGLTGVISQAHALNPAAADEVSFILLSSVGTAIFAAVGLLVLLLCGGRMARGECKVFFTSRAVFLALLLGVMMNVGNFLILLAAPHVGASIQFPLISGGTILFSAVAAYLFFRERPAKGEIWPLLVTLLSTVLFAF